MSDQRPPIGELANKRLFDLVRYMRSELHVAHLITDEEYTQLLVEGGGEGGSVDRLEDYDRIRARLSALEREKQEAVAGLRAELVRVRQREKDAADSGSEMGMAVEHAATTILRLALRALGEKE